MMATEGRAGAALIGATIEPGMRPFRKSEQRLTDLPPARPGGRAAARVRTLVIFLLGILAACQAAPAQPLDAQPVFDAAQLAATRYRAVLVAGDAAQPVFDNATRHLGDLLVAAGLADRDIHRLSAGDYHAGPATLDAVTARIASLHAGAGEGCFVFLTSHGSETDGLVLARNRESLSPRQLDRALSAGCGKQPTIVIVSACFSGMFVKPPMSRPNRIILTAARPDRTSFGCGTNFTYTYFDQCLLGAVDGADDWHGVYARARRCVAAHEAAAKQTPSEPQAHFGAAVAAAPALWRRTEPDGRLHFTAGDTRYALDNVPISKEWREHHRTELARYADWRDRKALALSPDGSFAWIGAGPRNPLTLADAQRIALQRCEWFGGPCILYAVENQVVAPLPSGLAPFHPPLLVGFGTIDPATVPFIRDDQRSGAADYLKLNGPKALVLGRSLPVIAYAAAGSVAAARDQALAKCRTMTRDCVVFAEDSRIVLDEARGR